MPNAQVTGNSKPPRSGAFEVTLDGKLIYSKFHTGNFPNTSDIKSWF
jgi:selT/selW/selH-like putative selenoprotein